MPGPPQDQAGVRQESRRAYRAFGARCRRPPTLSILVPRSGHPRISSAVPAAPDIWSSAHASRNAADEGDRIFIARKRHPPDWPWVPITESPSPNPALAARNGFSPTLTRRFWGWRARDEPLPRCARASRQTVWRR
jgi:hypothetical protein